MQREILRWKPRSFLPVAGREASVVKIYVFPEIAYEPARPNIALDELFF